jgi:hypothetical protein
MKITKTAVVFAQNLEPNKKIDVAKSFGSLMQSKQLGQKVFKLAKEIFPTDEWYDIIVEDESPFLSINSYKNGYSFVGDITKGFIENNNELEFNDRNDIAKISEFLKDYLIAEKATINAVGINFHGFCDVENPDDTLKRLMNQNTEVVKKDGFFPATIALGYNIDVQNGKPDTVAKVILEKQKNKLTFSANFNHDMISIGNSSDESKKSECKVFINKFAKFQNFLLQTLNEVIDSK